MNNIIQSAKIQEQGQDLENEIKEIEERNDYFTKQINLYKTQFFNLNPISDFYRSITRLAEESNLHIIALSPTTMGIDTTSEWLRIQINFSSGFLAIMRFITKIEEQGILIQIIELSLSKNRIDQSWIDGRIILSIHRLDL